MRESTPCPHICRKRNQERNISFSLAFHGIKPFLCTLWINNPLDYLLSLRFLESRPLYKKAVKGTAGPKVELRGATPSFKKIVVEQKGTNMRLAAE